ncbi:MAG TPA: bifunctional oligoribonuclease/PAP phosphatase NrnA [Opitutaceae bacterium]|nr:bifunctional oligoribonuclease/PAP phosphatase NrnA [Opitutaceae bacterium]
MAAFYPEFSPRFAEWLTQLRGREIAVVGHARPDGDCIGSQAALARVLRARGHEVVCLNPDAVPRRLEFLVKGLLFLRPAEFAAGDFAAVFVDCADHDRGGELLKARFPSPVGNIDHHLSGAAFAQHNFIDAASAATAEILAGMLLDNGLSIDAAAAQGLYVGILTDTGQFRYASTSRRTFLLAAELLARGANPAEAGYELYERETAGRLRLLQRFLTSLRFECGGRICIGLLPDGVFAETGALPEDTEGLVDYPRSIDSVDIGALIEERAGGIKASLRAKDPAYRLDLIAAQFNGGGHACAAGLNVKDAKIVTFYPRLVAALSAQLRAVAARR